MAWQLIYTSAPRLLEAGRSGFGTVARHRQISPLLVATIERASQFARLPGHDAGRVIFTHRIVAVAGGRFHVLSCIRDAGADYTGRTNHLAHHLVAEEREVAALGTRGPSSADVLLGMSWAGAWDEPPRFLEATDQIALADFNAQTGSQWRETTGATQNAWLLARGEASRGAYILYPQEADVRVLFAESLRLAPDRLWQTPFTTALQPSDEPSDFRWIGIEADSKLRTQAESSGRPVLDLTRPETLPIPDIPANAAIAGLPRPTAVSGAQTRAASPTRLAAQPQQAAKKNAAPLSARKPGNRKWLFAGAAVVLVGVIGFALSRPYFLAGENERNRRSEFRKRVIEWRIFGPQTADAFSKIDAKTIPTADQLLVEIGKANTALKELRFERMQDVKSGEELRKIGEAFGFEVPSEMGTFADQVRQIAAMNTAIAQGAAASSPERAGYDSLQRQREVIETFTKETQAISVFSPAVEDLRKSRERAEAATILGLLHPHGSPGENVPPAEAALVKEWLARGKPADLAAAKHFTEAEKLMKAWDAVRATRKDRVADDLAATSREARGVWPRWLIREANTVLSESRGGSAPDPALVGAAPVFPAASLYFFSALDAMKDPIFHELEKGFTFHLRSTPGANPTPLIDPGKNGKIRQKLADEALFFVDETGKHITEERGAETLQRPFVLIARNAAGNDVLQLWVAGEPATALLPARKGGLRRAGNTLTLDPAHLGFPGTPKNRMTLRVPAVATIAGGKHESLPVTDWAVDLGPLRDEIARSTKAIETQIKALETGSTAPTDAEVSTRFKEMKKNISDSISAEIGRWAAVERTRIERKENDERKREPLLSAMNARRTQRLTQAETDFGSETAPLFKQAGGCIKAFCQEASFKGRDPLFSAGAELCILNDNADAKALGQAFGAARREVGLAIRGLVTSEEIGHYQVGLRTLDSILVLLSPETAATKTGRGKVADQLAAKREELRRTAALPILSNGVPPGVYRLSAMADGVEIGLMEIEIPK